MAARVDLLLVPVRALALSAIVVGLFSSSAFAAAGDHSQQHRIWWRPTDGVVTTLENHPTQLHEHRVVLSFRWLHGHSLSMVDYPRTPSQKGTYEHELRFFESDTGEVPWCHGSAHDVQKNLPSGSYLDGVSADPGEYSWGIQGWRLEKDQIYAVAWNCDSPVGPEHNRFNLSAQIGHCHFGSCTASNVWSDTTNRLIPRKLGIVLDGDKRFEQSFTEGSVAGASFEDGLPPWEVEGGDAWKSCANPAYHKSCYAVFQDDDGGDPVRFSYWHNPPNAVSSSSLYADSIVRCADSNPGACAVTVSIIGRDDAGVDVVYGRVFTNIPRDGNWYALWHEAPGFDDSTVQWKFKLEAADRRIHFDYNQEYYLLPL